MVIYATKSATISSAQAPYTYHIAEIELLLQVFRWRSA